MTSKTLFCNLMKEDIKKKIWIIVVALIAFLFAGPTHMLMRLEDMYNDGYMVNETISESIAYYLSPDYFGNNLIPAVMAIVLGIAGFAYLFSKKKVDLYHSIPVKREKLFFSSYLNGVITYLFVYLLSLSISVISLIIQGHMTGEIWKTIGVTFIGELIHFLFFYHVTILAVMLTGNLLVCMAATVVLLFYTPVVAMIIEEFYGSYFLTFYSYYENGFSSMIPMLFRPIMSPVTALGYFTTAYSDTTGEVNLAAGLLLALVMAVIVLTTAVFLYKKRPSEVAGKALSFKIAEPIVRILVVIPIALEGGKYIQSMGRSLNSFWFWFGLLFVGVICHAVIEVIYRFDFKAVLNHKLQLIGSLVVAVLIALCFRFDWFGYDQYLPKEEQIESAAVMFNGIDRDMNSYQIQQNEDGSNQLIYSNKENILLENMKLQDKEAVLRLAEIGIEQLDYSEIRKQGAQIPRRALLGKERAVEVSEGALETEDVATTSYIIRYRLNNGKEIDRYYTVSFDSAIDAIAQIYDSAEYKEAAYQLAQIKDKNVITRAEGVNIWGDKVVSLTGDNMKEFLDLYTEEMKGLTIATMQEEKPVLRLDCFYPTGNYQDSMYGYYIYPSFEKTLEWIKSKGVAEETWDNQLQADRIEYIQVYDYGYLSDAEDYYEKYSGEFLYQTKNGIEDQEKIAELCNSLVLTNFLWSNEILYPIDEKVEFQIAYSNMNGMDYSGSAKVREGKLPAFVVEDLKKSMEEQLAGNGME